MGSVKVYSCKIFQTSNEDWLILNAVSVKVEQSPLMFLIMIHSNTFETFKVTSNVKTTLTGLLY